jgi:Flp pilus assembly pilin Flp
MRHPIRTLHAIVTGLVAALVASSAAGIQPHIGVPERRLRGERGQATTEYALILLAAALIGLLVVAWTTAGGAAGRIGELFDRVVDSVISRL